MSVCLCVCVSVCLLSTIKRHGTHPSTTTTLIPERKVDARDLLPTVEDQTRPDHTLHGRNIRLVTKYVK